MDMVQNNRPKGKRHRAWSTPVGDTKQRDTSFWATVNIDGKKIQVNYGSVDIYQDLLREWST